jgi:hypothetical protein
MTESMRAVDAVLCLVPVPFAIIQYTTGRAGLDLDLRHLGGMVRLGRLSARRLVGCATAGSRLRGLLGAALGGRALHVAGERFRLVGQRARPRRPEADRCHRRACPRRLARPPSHARCSLSGSSERRGRKPDANQLLRVRSVFHRHGADRERRAAIAVHDKNAVLR